MSQETVIVFDCGATNVRAVALNVRGEILSSESYPNQTRSDPYNPTYRIWDSHEIWEKMCLASRKIISRIDPQSIIGVTITTFGVDGTLFNRAGKMLYPVISWQCERTNSIMAEIDRYIRLDELYRENGVLPFNFNTINKLIWFIENRPELIEKCHRFLFMPSIFSFFLTGEMINDITMAGTSMMTSIAERQFSDKIFGKIGLPPEIMGPLTEPGTIIGKVTAKASLETLLPVNTPVVATGHDTQFAIFGSGAEKNQPVLSSGTWEILMVRAEEYKTGKGQLESGITTELDSRPGLYNIGNQWIASGVIEWARRNLFADFADDAYDKMISGAEKVPHGSNGIKVVPKFFEEMRGKAGGQILGLTMESTREEIFRAILEALSLRLAEGKEALENAGGFKADSIICVGGGSRNKLWNRLRANYSKVPLKIIDHKETTVLGASLFVMAACSGKSTPEEARRMIEYKTEIIEPDQNIPY